MNKKILLSLALLLGGGTAGMALAQAQETLPEWDKLSTAQREALIAPVRDRWNSSPNERARMLEHANHWQKLDPQQRERARKGMHRFEQLAPEQRKQARALFSKMRELPPEEQKKLAEQWKAMSTEQRDEWIKRNSPPEPRSPH